MDPRDPGVRLVNRDRKGHVVIPDRQVKLAQQVSLDREVTVDHRENLDLLVSQLLAVAQHTLPFSPVYFCVS